MGRVLRILARRHGVSGGGDGTDPFQVLVACVLSLRTKDEVTDAAAARLLARAPDPAAMLRLRAATISKLIFPTGFYRRKAAQLRAISRLILEEHDGRVPVTMEELLELPGVGRKTANLTLTIGHGRPGICVDTHVHRITNRLGWARTRHPDETEMALRDILPRRWWIPINLTLVRHGQRICTPLSPRCSECPVARDCRRIGVTRSR